MRPTHQPRPGWGACTYRRALWWHRHGEPCGGIGPVVASAQGVAALWARLRVHLARVAACQAKIMISQIMMGLWRRVCASLEGQGRRGARLCLAPCTHLVRVVACQASLVQSAQPWCDRKAVCRVLAAHHLRQLTSCKRLQGQSILSMILERSAQAAFPVPYTAQLCRSSCDAIAKM